MKLNLLNDMARICRLLSLLLLLAVGLAGCKTSRHSSSLSGDCLLYTSYIKEELLTEKYGRCYCTDKQGAVESGVD